MDNELSRLTKESQGDIRGILSDIEEAQRALRKFSSGFDSHLRALKSLELEFKDERKDLWRSEVRTAICAGPLLLVYVLSIFVFGDYIRTLGGDLNFLNTIFGILFCFLVYRFSYLELRMEYTFKTQKMLKKIIDDLEALK
jgi:hypothetical protein